MGENKDTDELHEIIEEIKEKVNEDENATSESVVEVPAEQVQAQANETNIPISPIDANSKDDDSENKYTCPICGKKFKTQQALGGHMRGHAKEMQRQQEQQQQHEQVIEEEGGEGGAVFLSPKEELEHWFISELERKMPKIASKDKAQLAVDTLKEMTHLIWDPNGLRYHIIQLCSGRVNKYLLDLTLQNLYARLEEQKRELEVTYGMPFPMLSPIAPPNGMSPMPFGMNSPKMPNDFRQQYPQYGMQQQYQQYPQYNMQQPQQPMMPVRHKVEKENKKDNELLMKLIDKLFDKLDKLEQSQKEEKKDKEPMVPMQFGEMTVQVPASQVPMFMMIKEMQKQSMDTQSAIFEVIQAISEGDNDDDKKKEPMVKIPVNGEIVEMPSSEAVFYLIMDKNKEEKERYEKQLRAMQEQMQNMYETLSPENLTKVIEQLGYQKSGSPTYDIINKTRSDLSMTMDRVLTIVEKNIHMQNQVGPPQLNMQPRYIEQERKNKITNIKTKLKQAEERALAENSNSKMVKDKKK